MSGFMSGFAGGLGQTAGAAMAGGGGEDGLIKKAVSAHNDKVDNAPIGPADPSHADHPIWDTMKGALGIHPSQVMPLSSAVQDVGAPNAGAISVPQFNIPGSEQPGQGVMMPENGMVADDGGAGSGEIEGMEDGGPVRDIDPNTGVPRYHTGTPGFQGAVHDLLEATAGHMIKKAQDTARNETAIRVNSNEEKAATGYADGGFVTPPAPNVQMTGRAAGIASGLSQGMAVGEDLKNAWLQHKARQAQEAALMDDPTVDPNAPSTAEKVRDTVMHPIQAVRGAVDDLAHFLKSNSHDQKTNGADAALPVSNTAAPAQSASSPAPAIDASAAPAPAAGAPTPDAGGGAAPAPAAGAPAPGAAAPGGAPAAPTPSPAAIDAAGASPQAAKAASAGVVQDVAAKTGTPVNLQQAAAQAKANPQAGKVTPHSLQPEFWEGVNSRAIHAAHLAAKAGLDPKAIYDSSIQMAVSHMQGQVMREYGAAYNALQAGNMADVKTALQNANYYLPNGKDLDFQTDPKTGSLQVRNPFIGMPGHEKDPPMIDINPQSISLMATAALHPENFHSEIAGMVKAETEARKDAAESAAKQTAAEGSRLRGVAAVNRAANDALQVNSKNYERLAHGDYYEGKGANNPSKGQPKVSVSQAATLQDRAKNAVTNASLGPVTVGSQTMPSPDGTSQIPNVTGTAGKVVHDPTKVQPLFKDLKPEELSDIGVIAGHFASGNAIAGPNGTPAVTPEEAAGLAATYYRWLHGLTYNEQTAQTIRGGPPQGGKHIRPGTGVPGHPKKEFDVDVVRDTDKGLIHVWMKDHWVDLYENQNIDNRAPGVSTEAADGGTGNPADNEPAVDPQDAAYDAKADSGE